MVTSQLTHGGAEKQLSLLAKGLQHNSQFKPIVFCLSQATEPYGSTLTAAGVEWHSPSDGTRSTLYRVLWLVRELSKSSSALVYGVLNSGNVYGGMAAMLSDLPFVGSIRSANAHLPTILRLFSGFFCRRARLVVANSPSCLESLRYDLGVKHNRTCVIPNAVSLPVVAPDARLRMRQKWDIPADAFLVGTIANLKVEKRIPFFLQVATVLHNVNLAPVYFVWIGEGPERVRLPEYFKSLPSTVVDKVRFPGATLDVANCLAAFDAFFLTSAYEGLPSALLEAMAARLPCIATNVPGTRDVMEASIGREIGLLADPQDPVQFANESLALLNNPEHIHSLRENAARHIKEKYGLDTMIDKFCNVFDSVIRTDSGQLPSWDRTNL